jgi:hypothetical protein
VVLDISLLGDSVTASISVLVIDMFKLSTSSWFILVGHICIEIYPFLLDFSSLFCYKFKKYYLMSFRIMLVFARYPLYHL